MACKGCEERRKKIKKAVETVKKAIKRRVR